MKERGEATEKRRTNTNSKNEYYICIRLKISISFLHIAKKNHLKKQLSANLETD